MQQRLKIMVVDDDPTLLSVTAAVLEEEGFDVVVRDSAIGTSLAISREKPDVVLLDVHMPGLSGDRIAELMAVRPGRTSPLVVLHSASLEQDLKELAASCGAADSIEKTANPQDFVRRLEKVLARHAAQLGSRYVASARRN
jgi:DNA-binding response OmpR family regulator